MRPEYNDNDNEQKPDAIRIHEDLIRLRDEAEALHLGFASHLIAVAADALSEIIQQKKCGND